MLHSVAHFGVFLAAGWLALSPGLSRAADPGSNTLSDPEQKAGWSLLFDGKTTDGWRNYNKQDVSNGWKVEDGALTRAASGAGDLITKKQYGSFELSLEYKISKGGNSGLMYYVKEQKAPPWHSGPEVQIQDNVDGHDPQKSGWLYQLYPASVDATKPAGEWNRLYIKITPEECLQYMNGVQYAKYKIGGKDWDQRVAKSKFGKFPEFGKAREGHICLQDHGNLVSFRNIKLRELGPGGAVKNPVDGALPLVAKPAFPNIEWEGWSPISEQGKPQPFRPIVLTHAGDGSNRIFVASERGPVYVFDNDPQVSQAKLFMDITDRVSYKDSQNEEGLLGLAFHPKFKENGQFFIYYSSKKSPQTSIISRFRVSGDNPNRADPNSEEEILRIKQPFWNHNGGTLAFGPDGYMYIALGDGGSANDPMENAQNLGTLLGSILRIDVDHKANGKNYAVPADNPFVKKAGAKGEIWAYGLRNVWRLSFDRQTGTLWAADVGQNLFEEIDIIVRGGNYGWNLREAGHPFGAKGVGPREDLIEPVWEYDHGVGKSITGGVVYRGQRLPKLQGAYLYADYVTGNVWALRYDTAKQKVLGNYSIAAPRLPIITFGEDEKGEAYFTAVSADGRGIYRFEPQESAK